MARRRRSGWSDWDYYDHYPRSTPRRAEGGIKSQSRRGQFGESWWAKRWIQVLEGFNVGARLARGRSYARSGQVLSISVEEGRVTAKVQGSRPKPYDVSIEVKTLSKTDWTRVLDALGRQAMFAAKLLAGEMPQDIEPVFAEVGLSLFPSRRADLTTRCSCPDASNPCKHIAAAYYLLGEEFDRDPFLIFTLRGLGREDLMARLEPSSARAVDGGSAEAVATPREPLTPEVPAFWEGSAGAIEEPCGVVEIPAQPSVLPRRLGGFPFWRGQSPFLETMGAVYAVASPRGLDVYLVDRGMIDETGRPTGAGPGMTGVVADPPLTSPSGGRGPRRRPPTRE
jgi:uncharacterized Zn finger protein